MPTPLNIAAFQAPTKPTEPTKADWQTLDISTLSPDLGKLYHDYRQVQAHANTARKAFEDAMSAKVELPNQLALAFGYKFGKVSIAIVPAERPRTGRPAMSLADLVKRAG